eukprot:844445-Alexandrium_andersonii.AAC.1
MLEKAIEDGGIDVTSKLGCRFSNEHRKGSENHAKLAALKTHKQKKECRMEWARMRLSEVRVQRIND